MTFTLAPLHDLPKLAALYVKEHGWTQGTEQDGEGKVCLTGALRFCSPVPGDGYIAREVFRRREHAEAWNDENGRIADEVIDYLAQAEITDAELAETFGPQWQEIIAQVRTISSATTQQIEELSAAWAAARGAAWDAAWDAAWAAARGAAWDAAWAAASAAAWDAASDAAWDAASAAARDAAWALVTRDLIGTNGYTQQHYDKLTAPWVTVFGKLHTDDVIA